jgi:hypothetical protein
MNPSRRLRRANGRIKIPAMPLVHRCATDGCGTLTMGEFCLECERDQEPARSQPLTRESDAFDDVDTTASLAPTSAG